MMSAGQQALQDMIELEMYLLAQPQGKPWLMVPRRLGKPDQGREPISNLVQSWAATELLMKGLIEPTSSRTFVVSKSGREFYRREMISPISA
jgi:hypothetical protein